MLELGMCGVRASALSIGQLARVLHGEGGSDDEDFAEAAFGIGRENHAADARIDGQGRREFGAERCQVVTQAAALHGADLEERVVAVPHVARVGRLHERELFDLSEAERLHLQDDAGEGWCGGFRAR